MTNALTTVPVADIERMAQAVAKSRLFGIQNPEQAMALMLVAQAEGLHPATAARDYHIISGKPALKADAMLARFLAAGGKVRWVEMNDAKVEAEFSHPAGGTVTIDWTTERAKRAGITNDMHRKYPRQMLRARVISEGIRTVYPGCAVGVYTPEEVADFDAPKPTVTRVVDAEPAVRVVERDWSAEAAQLQACGSLGALSDAWRSLTPEARKALAEVKDECKQAIEAADAALIVEEVQS